MQYIKEITIPKETAENNPKEEKLKISDGVIHKIVMVFPAGCAGLAHVQLYDGAHPIAPSTQGQYFEGDDRVIDFPEFYEIKGAPRIITIKGYNDDDIYPHTITVEIYVLPKIIVAPLIGLDRMVRAIINLFSRTRQENL